MLPSSSCGCGAPCALLTARGHAAAAEAERARLSVRGDAVATAAVQLLWRMMTVETAGHVRLRYVLCEVWRTLFADAQPRCLTFAPMPIGAPQVLDGFIPMDRILAQRRAARLAKRKGRGESRGTKVRLQSITNFTGAGRPQLRVTVKFHSAAAMQDVVTGEMAEWERQYRERAERQIARYGGNATVSVAPGLA